MSFFHFFSLCAEFSEDNTAIVATVLSIVLCVCIIALAALLVKKPSLNSADIVYGGVATALAFVLSFIKFSPVQYGGSITLASMVPLVIYAYFFGFAKGLIVGIVYGLLQFVQDPYILTPITFVLDYLLAFAAVALAALPKKFIKNECGALCLGATFTYALRFLFHFVSGIVYFSMGAVWADITAESAVVYSLIYQIVYLLPDLAFCVAALFALSKLGVTKRLAPHKK